MDSLNLADTFVTFLALIGPQKVLLSFARLARTLDDHSVRVVAVATAWHRRGHRRRLRAHRALAGDVLPHQRRPSWSWPPAWCSSSTPSAWCSASTSTTDVPHKAVAAASAAGTTARTPTRRTRCTSGFRAMLLPFVVSPLAVAADLEESLSASGWGGRWTVAGAFALVALVDMLCTWAFAPLLRRMHDSVLEVLSRLLGILLAAVGVGVFLDGLTALGVVLPGH